MLHIITHGQETIEIISDKKRMVINPRLDSPHTIKRIDANTVDAVICSAWFSCDQEEIASWSGNHNSIYMYVDSSEKTFFDSTAVYRYINDNGLSCLEIIIGQKSILYVHSYTGNFISPHLATSYDVCIPCLYDTTFDAYAPLFQKVKFSDVIPVCEKTGEQAIEFCRQVMLNQVWVPKYLKPGQYLVLE